MKLLQALTVTSLLLATGFAFVPTASADTCVVADPTLDTVVCGAYGYAWCIVGGGPKEVAQRLVLCDVALLS